MSIEVEIDCWEVELGAKAMDRQMPILAGHVAEDSAKAGLAFAKARRRYKDRTGGLTGKAYAQLLRQNSGGAEAVIAWPVPYASFVDEGTAPHGNHPGTKPYAFAGDAYLAAERYSEAALDKQMAGLLRAWESV